MRLTIENGRVIDPASGFDQITSIYIADGLIVGIGQKPAGFSSDAVLSAKDWVVCPGLIDLSVHLNSAGLAYRSMVDDELAAAVKGGVTSLACLPDTQPVLDHPDLVLKLKQKAALADRPHVYPIGALTKGLAGEQLSEMGALSDAGCIAFGQADQPIANTKTLLNAAQYAATFNYPLWLSPQDHYLSNGLVHDGELATKLGLAGVPTISETIAVSRLCEIASTTRVKLHLSKITCADSLPIIEKAKENGVPLSCGIGATYLHFTDQDIKQFNTQLLLNPVLRTSDDQVALSNALSQDFIDVIYSDHRPVSTEEKRQPFSFATPGNTGVELLLPLCLAWAESVSLGLIDALKKITCNPANIAGLSAGLVQVGQPADLCVFDPTEKQLISTDTLKSQGKNTPFLNQTLKGKVKATLITGHCAFLDDKSKLESQ